MMDDLVNRLREPFMHVKHGQDLLEAWRLERAEAADRIDALAAKLAEVEASSQGWIDAAVNQQVRRKRAEARLLELEAERDALNDPRVLALMKKARAVVDRWDSPLWKDLPHTGESIAELRAALSALEENK